MVCTKIIFIFLLRLLDLHLSEEQISISSTGSQVYLSASQLATSSRLVSQYAELYSRTRALTLHSLDNLPELAAAQVPFFCTLNSF